MKSTTNYSLTMPAHYVELSSEEMEYDGAFKWTTFFAAISVACYVVSVGVQAVASAGFLSSTDANNVSSVASTIGKLTASLGGLTDLWSTA